jgi:TonB-dependent SusC/RagA subfamily outer membrane receptor
LILPKQIKPANAPLYVLNGKPQEAMPDIAPENIESMTVLKSEQAIAIYGERGKNGVFLIQTKL